MLHIMYKIVELCDVLKKEKKYVLYSHILLTQNECLYNIELKGMVLLPLRFLFHPPVPNRATPNNFSVKAGRF